MRKVFSQALLIALMLIIGNNYCFAQDVNELLANLKKEIAHDGRTSIWDINAQDVNGTWNVTGKVDNNITKHAIINMLDENKIKYSDSINVLEYKADKAWGLVMLSIASLRTQGRHAAEMATQAIMGTPVKILEEDDDWVRVQLPDNYIAYIPDNSIIRISQLDFDKWRKAKRYIVTAYQSQLVEDPNSDMTVSDLVMGNILTYKGEKDGMIELSTPDGRCGFVSSKDVAEFSSWAEQSFDNKRIEKTARRMMGSGYLWGGTSTKITDCSGLAKVSYFSNGIILQRDASQQALTGQKISPTNWKEAQLGDLLFFGSKSGKVTHVGIYLKDGQYIHCSGRVKINSVDPDAKDYLTTPFLSISRIAGKVGSKGITAVKNHIWYF